ncbi:MAG: hypothetical protein Q7T20_09305 [Saprospiraceae bacterium]|nr:hypothetical protein [Saprospiraceae bacterium]
MRHFKVNFNKQLWDRTSLWASPLIVLLFLAFLPNTFAQSWFPAKDDGCIGDGKRQWSARLNQTGGNSWEDAANQTPIYILGVDQGTPDKTSNHGLGGMWGEWYLNDNTCKANWSDWKDNGCTGTGKRTYYARLENTRTNDWKNECENTSFDLNGKTYSKPTRCIDKGVLGMWGEIDVTDGTCKANWSDWTEQGCNNGMKTYYARLEHTVTNNWKNECENTSVTLNGKTYVKPTRCIDKGVLGMWGEIDLVDASCVGNWGSWVDEGCSGYGFRRFSAKLENAKTKDLKNEGKLIGFTFREKIYPGPSECVYRGDNMYGILIIKDKTCEPEWGDWNDKGCTSDGIRTYSAQLENATGIELSDQCPNIDFRFQDIDYPKPTRCINKGAEGMWGEIEVSDGNCKAHWGPAQRGDCIGDNMRQYTAVLQAPAGASESLGRSLSSSFRSKAVFPSTVSWKNDQYLGTFVVEDTGCAANNTTSTPGTTPTPQKSTTTQNMKVAPSKSNKMLKKGNKTP